jgi:hypothetical protein
MSGPLVEVLTFEGCPHAEPALDLVRRVVADAGVAATVRRVDVSDPEAAMALRFLGSPTIRINGRDIEPGAGERNEYVLSCRLYRTENGLRGEPHERWLRDALHPDA